jgi:hypothetical protein
MGEALRYCSFILLLSLHVVITGTLVLLISLVCFPFKAHGQNLVRLPDAAPPVQYIPGDVRAMLTAEERDLKKRTRLSLEMADERLQQAAQFTALESYGSAAGQLGIYQALVADVIKYLQQNGRSNNRTRDLSKRVELTLRAHIPRIETIRRATPSDEAIYVRALIEYLRLARAEALNTFYGDTVVRDNVDSQSDKPAVTAQPFKEPGPAPPR